jgi:hypothetical protein
MPTYRGEQLTLTPLATPDPPTLTVNGTTGATTYGYKCVAKRGSVITDASSEATATDGPATLTATNHIRVTPPYVAGATGYDIYRTTGGGTQGKIGSITAHNQSGVQRNYLADTGRTGDSADEPTQNLTGELVAGGRVMMANLPTADPLVLGQLYNDSGTLKVSAGD